MINTKTMPPHWLGMALMACVAFIFATHDAVSRSLIFVLPVIFVAWVRYLIHALVMTVAMVSSRKAGSFRTQRPWLHFLRAVCLLGDSLSFLFGLIHVPIAESTALAFLAPAFITLLSPLLLGIKATRLQWISVFIGLAGVVAITHPGSESFSWWMLFPVTCALFFALYQMLTQLAGQTDSPAVSSFYVGVFSTAILSLCVPFFWATPSLEEWGMLGLLGCLGLSAHFLLAKSYKYASSVLLAPLGYLQIVFATGYGMVWFGSYPGPMSLSGIGLIFLSGLIVYLQRLPSAKR